MLTISPFNPLKRSVGMQTICSTGSRSPMINEIGNFPIGASMGLTTLPKSLMFIVTAFSKTSVNLILNETGATIIDWVDSSAGDRKADAYRTYLLYSQYSMELANLYLRIYCEKSGLFQDDIFAWESIIAGARLSENVASEKANRLLEIVARYCRE